MKTIDPITNKSGNRTFHDVLNATSRRNMLRGSLVLFLSGMMPRAFAQDSDEDTGPDMDFTPVRRASANDDWLAISEDYEYQTILPWGDPITPSGPAFSYPPTAEQQERQIGIGHDGMWFFPIENEDEDDDVERGVLCLNHEFGGTGALINKSSPESLADVRVSQHAHGVSVLHLAKIDGAWTVEEGCGSRRIHVNTPVEFGGPARDSELLSSPIGREPAGTVNNCGCGKTPWNTYLTCEENFHGYFGTESQSWSGDTFQNRYSFTPNGFGYGWHVHDKRFDLSHEDSEGEENRFGWVVEIDPFDNTKRPVKRTALGRFRHEACEIVVGEDNRVVAYMGDDAQFEYVYKFVSEKNYQELLDEGKSPLDHGKLYVAIFRNNNRGQWVELTEENNRLRTQVGDQSHILTYARSAAYLLNATGMDRPEWITATSDGEVYIALTNNTSRGLRGPANPVAPNPDGHIVQLSEGNHVGTTFTWSYFKEARNTRNTEEAFSDPDCIYVDPDGRLFIATDGTQPDNLNNQLVVANTVTKAVKRLFSGVPGCEITGLTPNKDRTTLFVNVQHPGNWDLDVTDFPRLDDEPVIPRDATIAIRRKNGGIVGT